MRRMGWGCGFQVRVRVTDEREGWLGMLGHLEVCGMASTSSLQDMIMLLNHATTSSTSLPPNWTCFHILITQVAGAAQGMTIGLMVHFELWSERCVLTALQKNGKLPLKI